MDDMHFSFKIENPPAWLPIGRTAENDWRTIEIDCSYWFNMDATGNVVLMYRPSCGMSPYPLLTERDGDNIVWHPKSGELVEGVGQMQAFFYVGESKIGSSKMVSCEVDGSLLGGDPGTDPGAVAPPWAIDIIEQIAVLSGHYPKIIDGNLYIWDSALNEWVEFEASGGGAVDSVNGKTGTVVLDASDVGALPDDTPIPAAVTEQTVSGWGFTKNTGTYSKPSGGIPKTDLASAVQTSLGKADTALQTAPVSSVNGKTGAVVLDASDVGALPDDTVIPSKTSDLENDSGFITALQAQSLTPAQQAQARSNIDAAKLFVVSIESEADPLTANKTFDETFAAIQNGMLVRADLWNMDGDLWLDCINAEPTQIVFGVDALGMQITLVFKPDESLTRTFRRMPTVVSELTNDSGYQTAQDVQTAISPLQTKAITDTGGYFTTDTVEGALQEIGAELAGINTLIGSGVIT